MQQSFLHSKRLVSSLILEMHKLLEWAAKVGKIAIFINSEQSTARNVSSSVCIYLISWTGVVYISWVTPKAEYVAFVGI